MPPTGGEVAASDSRDGWTEFKMNNRLRQFLTGTRNGRNGAVVRKQVPIDLSLRRKVNLGFVIALAVMSFIGIMSWRNTRKAMTEAQAVAHTHEVMRVLQEVYADVMEVESGLLSYMAAGGSGLTEAHRAALQEIGPKLKGLRELTRDNPTQQQRLAELETHVKARIDFMRKVSEGGENSTANATQQFESGEGRRVAEAVRTLIESMQQDEVHELAQRSRVAQEAVRMSLLIAVLGTVAGLSFLTAAGLMINREITTSKEAREELRNLYGELEHRVVERTEQLSTANEKLYREIEDRIRAEQNMHELSGQLLRVQDEERRRLARELHDTTAQHLAVLSLSLGLLKNMLPDSGQPRVAKLCADSLALAEQSSLEIRTMAYLLHPPLLDAVGLAGAVREYAEGFSKRSGINVGVESDDDIGRFSRDAELALFRVVQESLSNVMRHSGSVTANIRVTREPKLICVEVSDAGHGIPAEKLAAITDARRTTGVGTAGMRERLRQLGGHFEVESSPKGTTVRACLPVGDTMSVTA